MNTLPPSPFPPLNRASDCLVLRPAQRTTVYENEKCSDGKDILLRRRFILFCIPLVADSAENWEFPPCWACFECGYPHEGRVRGVKSCSRTGSEPTGWNSDRPLIYCFAFVPRCYKLIVNTCNLNGFSLSNTRLGAESSQKSIIEGFVKSSERGRLRRFHEPKRKLSQRV